MTLIVAAVLATGCASSGAVPRPRPFPGAGTPAAEPPVPRAPLPPGLSSLSGVVDTALTYLGTPYRYGGSDPRGFDCSGFVQYVFARHGVALPREVGDQYHLGRRVQPSDVKQGDLIFFSTVARGPSHVGMAISNSTFVHAPSSKGVVRVERFGSRYWARRLVAVKRLH